MTYQGHKKGEQPDAPYEADDTLRSTALAKVLDLLGEGEWHGLVDGPASIYFDDTPLAVRDPSYPDGYRYNFQGVRWTFRHGMPDQRYIPGFAQATNEVGVGVEVKTETSVTRSVIDENVDAIAVRISMPGMQSVDDDGNVKGTSVTFSIYLKAASDADFVLKQKPTVSGKASTTFEKAYLIDLHGDGPWQVKVVRDSANSTDKNRNQTVFAGFTEIIYARLRYPHSVLTGLEFDAAYFDSVPQRSYDVRMLKVKVPINRMYDMVTDKVEYLGPWDGRMKAAREWCDNPAWCVYDALTAHRYGLGRYLVDGNDVLVDKAALYKFGRYADELVNGRRRFTCNVYFQTQLDAFDFVNQMASVFRGMAMWASGMVTFAQDAPSDPEYLFNNTNVEAGQFSYQSNSRRERITAAFVYWIDPEQGYRRVAEYVEDRAAILRYGFNPSNVTAVGCANRAQAIEMGRWLIYGSCYEPDTVTFKTGIFAAFLKPGAIIQVQDEQRAGKRIAGRLREVPGAYAVTLDQEIALEAGVRYVLKLVYPINDTGGMKVFEAEVTSPPGVHRTITHVGGFPSLPAANMVFIVSSVNLEPQHYRVTSITEVEPGKYQFTATSHEPGKFDFVERAIPLPERATTVGVRPAMPTGLQISDELYLEAANVRVLMRIDFIPDSTANKHFVRFRRENSNWETFGPFDTPYAEIPNVLEGQYVVEVWSKNILGMESEKASTTYTVLGKSRPPSDTAITAAALQRAGILVTMAPVTDLDFDVLELRWAVSNVGWEAAELVDRVKGTTALLTTAFGKGTEFWFYARAVDTSGNYSAGTAAYQFTVQLPSPPRYLTAVANLGYIDTHWEAGERADFYELRAGESWATGEYIGRTSDLAYTFEWARPGQAYFWVEAYDALGNPSGRPAVVNKDVAKTSGRNVVYEVDYAGGGWPGRLLNLVNSGISLDLSPGRFYGEYVSRFSIAYRHRVLVAMDGQVNAVYEDGRTWEDMNFPWDDPQADVPWWKPGDIAQVEVAHYMAVDTDEVDPTLAEELTFEDTLDGTTVTGTSTSPAPAYAPGIFDTNGLQVSPVAGMTAALATPAVFTYHFWHIVSASHNAQLLRLEDGSGNWLQLGYNAASRTIYVRRSEGETASVVLTMAPSDAVFLGVSQGGGVLRLFAMKQGIPYRYAEIAVAGAHGYTTLKLN